MKNIIKYGVTVLTAVFIMVACSPQENKDESLGTVIQSSEIKVDITTDSGDPNLFHFKLNTPSCLGVFSCPEAGIYKTGTEFSQRVVWNGTYTLSVQVYNPGGLSDAVTIPFNVPTTDPAICDNEISRLLTGGCDADNGKTWRINNSVSGHVGCGAEDADSNNWWNPAPNELKPELYDDDMTFYLKAGQPFKLDNKGASLMNESTASLFPDGDSSGSFVTTHYKPAQDASWSVVNENGENWLVINKGFPAYAVNPNTINSGRYKIISLTETDMHIVLLPGGISWHYLLTSKPR